MQKAEGRRQNLEARPERESFLGVCFSILPSAFCLLHSGTVRPNVAYINTRDEPLHALVPHIFKSLPASSFLMPSSRNFLFCASGAWAAASFAYFSASL